MTEYEESIGGLEPGWEPVLPFVLCQSQGGPYEDSAFVAGWAMGDLRARLRAEPRACFTERIRLDHWPMLDLIVMELGRSADPGTFAEAQAAEVDGSGWITVHICSAEPS